MMETSLVGVGFAGLQVDGIPLSMTLVSEPDEPLREAESSPENVGIITAHTLPIVSLEGMIASEPDFSPSQMFLWAVKKHILDYFPRYGSFVREDGKVHRRNNKTIPEGEESNLHPGGMTVINGNCDRLAQGLIKDPQDRPTSYTTIRHFEDYSEYMKQHGKKDGAHLFAGNPDTGIAMMARAVELYNGFQSRPFHEMIPSDYLMSMPFTNKAENLEYIRSHLGNKTRQAMRVPQYARQEFGMNVETVAMKTTSYGTGGGRISRFDADSIREDFFICPNATGRFPSLHPNHPVIGVYSQYAMNGKGLELQNRAVIYDPELFGKVHAKIEAAVAERARLM